CARDDPFAYW
nr:immunoglobulin heavy chain junction region [Mus musculus]